MGCICLLIFIFFQELWIGSLAFGLGFTVIFVIEVFYERAKGLLSSVNFYAALICYALTYAQYAHGLITKLMTFR